MTEPPLLLVADDDPDILSFVVPSLEQAGFRVLATGDGLEALQLLMNERPALGILDIGMPTLEGTAVLRIVRTMGDDAPAIMFMTAHGLPSDRADGFELGALDYVVKPFDMRELIVRVNHCLEHERR